MHPSADNDLREVFNALRYVVKTGCQWRMLPHALPDWTAVYQQARRWMQAGVLEDIVHDLRIAVRVHQDRSESPTAVTLDGRTLQSTPESGNEQECAQVGELATRVQAVTGRTVELAYVDQRYTGEHAAQQASAQGIVLEVVQHTEAKKGFVLLPRRWVVERTFGWLGRFRRLARDYERLANVLAGWHWLAFVVLLLKQVVIECQ